MPPQTTAQIQTAQIQARQDAANAASVVSTVPAQTTAQAVTAQIQARQDALNAQNPQPKVATEPAVVSSTTIDKLNQDNATKLATMGQKGTTVGEDGSVQDATGAVIPTIDPKSYDATSFYGGNQDGDWGAVQRLFAPLQASLDSNTQSSINAIQQQFEGLKADQTAYNAASEKGRSRALLLGGSSRYAPLAAGSNQLSQVSYGLRQIADLDAKENMAIAQAKQAQQDGNMRLMDSAITMAEGIRKEKQTAAAKVMSDLSDARKKAADAHQAAMRDESIADVMAGGVTDPAQILKTLNAQGGDFTADEVSKAMKNLVPAETKGLYKFSNDDVGKMLASGMNANQIQATQDYYNGHGQAPELSGTQRAAVTKALAGAVPAGDGGSSFKFTPTQKSQLLSGNFTAGDIANMQADVAVHGIDAVVAGMPADQAALVKRVLAGSDSVASTGVGNETKLTRAELSKMYGIPDDNGSTGGFLGIGGTSNKEQLDALENIVNQYKEFYTDKEILDMIQKQQ